MRSLKPGRINTGDTVQWHVCERDVQYHPPDGHLQAVERLAECRGSGDRIEIEGIMDTRHLDKFVNEVTVRGRLLHLQAEQDDMLAEREPCS